MVLPVLLVRTLSPEDFGNYRLVWLIAMTALAFFPLAMPLSLFNFLPKAGPMDRPRLVGNALLFLTLSGALAAMLLALNWSWLPASVSALQRFDALVPGFLGLWVIGSLLDTVPTADGNARWQAKATIGFAIVRTAALALAAVLSRDLTTVLVTMCIVALVKALLVPIYALAVSPPAGLALDFALLKRQLRFSLPFAVGSALFLLRGQADQWIVASYFPPEVFALISIAAIVMSVSSLVRQPLNNATLPRLSGLIGQGDTHSALELLGKSYSALGLLLLPLLGLLFLVSHEIVEIVYTPAYLGAAPLMQLYLIGQMTGVFAAGHLLVILNAGRLSTTISAVCLAISVVCSLLGVHWFGLPGAVAGSVLSLIVGEVWALLAVTRRLGTTVAEVINLRVTGRAIGSVAAAIVLVWGLQDAFMSDWSPWLRLAATTACFVVAIAALGLYAGLHAAALPLLRGLLSRSG